MEACGKFFCCKGDDEADACWGAGYNLKVRADEKAGIEVCGSGDGRVITLATCRYLFMTSLVFTGSVGTTERIQSINSSCLTFAEAS